MNRKSKETVIMEMTMAEAEAECQRQVDRYHRLLPWVGHMFRTVLVAGAMLLVATVSTALYVLRHPGLVLSPEEEQGMAAWLTLFVVLCVGVPGLVASVISTLVDEAACLSHVAYLRAASLRGVDPHTGV